MIESIKSWNGKLIEIVRSRGASKTQAVLNPYENLIKTGIVPWPPPEIVQKLCQSNQASAFADSDRDSLQKNLGYYCDLQSLNSEDAITWSVFGTTAYSQPRGRSIFVKSLMELEGLGSYAGGEAIISLWRRQPHPDTLVSGGPEIDFLIQTAQLVVFGEAKWGSGIGKGQGKMGGDTQIDIRRKLFENYAHKIYGKSIVFVLLGVSIKGNMLEGCKDNSERHIFYRDIKWGDVCNLKTHPLSNEVNAYYTWKRLNSTTSGK